jgi:DNA-directed RNA polymerase subunit beta'
MGGEAFIGLLQRLDLDELSYTIAPQSKYRNFSQQRKKEALKRLQVVEALRAQIAAFKIVQNG